MARSLSVRILTGASLILLLSILPTAHQSTLGAQITPGAPPPPPPLAPCDPDCPPDPDDPPLVIITPPHNTEYDSVQQVSVSIEWCDDTGLNASSREIKFNGQDSTSAFTYTTPGFSEECGGENYIKRSQGTVTLQEGINTLSAKICDVGGQCTTEIADWGVPQPGAPIVALHNHFGDNLDRSQCLTSSAGEAAARQCEDLIITHALPGYSTMGRERSLTLIYNSATAAPKPKYSVWVRESIGVDQPDSVRAEVKYNGTPKASASYAGFGAGPAKHVSIGWGETGLSTGLYEVEIVITNIYNGATNYSTTITDTLIQVNRRNSEFGHGWWLLGVERIYPGQLNSSVLWVGGDGSAKVYREITTNTWLAPAGGYRDTLTYSSGTQTYTRTLRHGVQVKYDAAGRHIETIDRTGQKTTFTWYGSPNIRLRSIERAPDNVSGNTDTLTYQQGDDKIHKITDPAGRELTATISSGKLTRLTDPDGEYVDFTYAGDYRVLTRRTRRGFKTRFAWASGGMLWSVFVPLIPSAGDTAQTKFWSWRRPVKMGTTGNGGQTATDSADVYAKVKGPRSGVADTAKFWIDRWGAPERMLLPVSDTTYIVRGDTLVPAKITRVEYPDGRVVNMTWDTLGNLTRMVDSVPGLPVDTTRWTYQDSNAPFSPNTVTDGVGVTTTFFYNTMGLPDSVRSPNGHKTEFQYDTSGSLKGILRKVKEHDVSTWVDSTMTETDQDLVTEFFFNALGNVDSVSSPMSRVRKFERDGTQRVEYSEDPAGHRTRYIYDELNRVTKVRRYDGSDSLTTTYNYDVDVITSIVDPRSVTRSWAYDAAGRDTLMTDAFGKKERKTFDKAGNLLTLQSRYYEGTGNKIEYLYDAAGRLTKMKWPARNSAAADSALHYYDIMGRDTLAKAGLFEVRRTYFANGLLDKEVQALIGGGNAFTHQYDYDAVGRRTSYKIGDTTSTHDDIWYRYNSTTGELKTIGVQWRGGEQDSVVFVWDALGRRDTLKYSSRSTTSSGPIRVGFAYDGEGQLRRMCSTHTGSVSGDVLKARVVYEELYDDGLPKTLSTIANQQDSDCTATNPSIQGAGSSNTYDALHRLTMSVSVDSMLYGYDKSGNMTLEKRFIARNTGSLVQKDFSIISGSNRLDTMYIGGSWVRYSYYNDGARKETYPNGTGPGWRWHYYDGLGRLTGTSEWQCEPSYDGNGNLLSEGCGTQAESSEGSCHYDPLGRLRDMCGDNVGRMGFDGSNVVRTGADNASYQWTFVHGPGTDDPLMGHLDQNGTDIYVYYVTDGQGRQYAVADSTGESFADKNHYMTGGKLAGGTQVRRTLGFGSESTSQAFDAERMPNGVLNELSFFRNRFYDMETGRWTQEDPLGVSAGTNLYAYVGNDPVSFLDPFGLCAKADTITVIVTVRCPNGKPERQAVAATPVDAPSARGDLIAVGSNASISGSAADTELLQAGNEALTDAALFGNVYMHPSRTAAGLEVLTAGGAAGTSMLSFREDVWQNIKERRSTATVGGIMTCAVVAHEGMHLALSGRGTPDLDHTVLTPKMTGSIQCR